MYDMYITLKYPTNVSFFRLWAVPPTRFHPAIMHPRHHMPRFFIMGTPP